LNTPAAAQRNRYVGAMIRGLRTSVFLLRIILPLSFAVGLLDWLGVLRRIGEQLAPLMHLWRVPGEAAVVLVSGWLVGIYGAVAAIAILPLTPAQITILSVMTLTAHNLVVETTVQHKTGTPWWIIVPVRLLSASIFGWIVALIIVPGGQGSPLLPALPGVTQAVGQQTSFQQFILHWLRSAGSLAAKIVVILLALMLLTEWMRARDLYHRLARSLRPFLRFLGLADSVAFLWITTTVLGLAYGSGLLMEEARVPGAYPAQDLRDFNVSAGVCHSVVEDSALLAACGASLLWITLPRLVLAAAVTRLTRLLAPAR
jgi:hypothetical protein